MTLTAYYTISLLSYMAKAIEKVVVELPAEEVECGGRLSDGTSTIGTIGLRSML